MGRALQATETFSPAIFAKHGVAGVINTLSDEETADYIGTMLFALEGMASAKNFSALSRALAHARAEAKLLR